MSIDQTLLKEMNNNEMVLRNVSFKRSKKESMFKEIRISHCAKKESCFEALDSVDAHDEEMRENRTGAIKELTKEVAVNKERFLVGT